MTVNDMIRAFLAVHERLTGRAPGHRSALGLTVAECGARVDHAHLAQAIAVDSVAARITSRPGIRHTTRAPLSMMVSALLILPRNQHVPAL